MCLATSLRVLLFIALVSTGPAGVSMPRAQADEDLDGARLAAGECAGYAHARRLPDSDLVLCWRLDEKEIALRLVHPGRVWIGFGFGRSMAASDAVVGRLDTGAVADVHMSGRTLDAIRPGRQQDLRDASITERNGLTVLGFRRALDTGDGDDRRIAANGRQPVIWAVGSGSGFRQHADFGRADVDFGTGAVAPMGHAWLLVLHALLMVASWGLAVPALLVITRFYKVTPGQNFPAFTDNPFWFFAHRRWMTIVVVVSTLAMGLALWELGGVALDTLHGKIGLAVVALGWAQQVLSYYRGTHGGPWDLKRNPKPREQWSGDHYNMSLRRCLFEAIHIPSGYLTALAGILAVLTGFYLFELAWPWYAAYGAFLLGILALYWKYTRDGRHIRTYVALWGASPEHPGNRRG
jgi:hypothetical protein